MGLITGNLADFPLDRRSCELLGPTALVVQALLGVLAVLSLVYKRHRETQKRPWKIWLFDVSKQVIGAMFVHGLNVLISDLGSHHSSGNACTYYFLNILLDTTLGVGLIYVALQGATWLLSKKLGIKGLKMGQYGNPPSLTYWVRQAAVYVFSITTMKFLVVALFTLWPSIFSIGDWLLGWTFTEDGDAVQVIFVMGIFPIIMNIIQFWLIDSIVKASTNSTGDHFASPRNSDSLDREPLFNSPDNDDDDSPRDVENVPRSSTPRTTSGGDIKALIGTENDKTKPSVSGSSSPMTLPRTTIVVAHDYPPNGTDDVSPQNGTRTRHKYKRSPSLFEGAIAYSAPAVHALDSTRNSSRQALLSKSLDGGKFGFRDAEFDTWEKNEREERSSGEGRTAVRTFHASAR